MVLSNVNVAKTSGNGPSSVIRKIHNMPWLKQATAPKNSDQGRATGGAMFNPLANLKEDGQTASEKKSKRRNKKSRNLKQKTDVPNNTEIKIKSNDMATRLNARGADDLVTKDFQLSEGGGQPGVGKGVWSTDKNIVVELFPGAVEAARNEQLEEEELKMAVAASLQSALLEKCAIDPPEEDNVEAVKLSDDENIWDGVHKNLPSPSGVEAVGDFDANNNSGVSKSRSSSVATRKSSCEGSKAAAIETPAPVFVPTFIDKLGRLDGYTEKRMFMAKGARRREDEYRRNLQKNDDGGSANGPNQRPRNSVGYQDPRPRNARYSAGNSCNDNRAAGNGPNDRYSHDPPRRSRHARQFADNPRNEPRGPSPQTVIAQLRQQSQQHNQQPQDNQQPLHNQQQQQQPKHQQPQQRGSHPTQASHRPRNHQAEEDSRNDRQQGRFSRHDNPDCRYSYRDPYDSTKKNPYKYVRTSDDGHKRISEKSACEHENRTNDATREGDEKIIRPLMSTTVEPPSTTAVQQSARESSTPIDRSLVETPGEAPVKIEPGISPKESTEFAGDPVRPQFHLSDFNNRYKTSSEHTAVPARPNPACSTNCSHSVTTIGHTCMAGIQIPPARFSVPPPGFAGLENTQSSASNAAYVLPVDSSLGGSAYIVPAESSRTSSAYCLPTDSASDSFSEIQEMEAVYARLKMYDPMLYDLLMKKGQRTADRPRLQMHAAGYPMIPENSNVLPVDPRSFQGTATSYAAPAEQPSETLNLNAKQYSPISKQAWISHDQQDPMSCYSVPPSYDPQSTGVYCQYVGQPQDIIRHDNSGWIPAGPQHYAAVHAAHHHVHFANEPTAPIAIGRQSYLVSEHNLSYNNAQRPLNLQQLNDDYPIRCQTSGFDDISTDPQRQMQYRALHRQCGIAPNQFCSMPCQGSYGNQTAMTKFMNDLQQPPLPLQQYSDFVLRNQNSMNRMNQGNVCIYKDNDQHIPGFAQQGGDAREQISINQSEVKFVQPVIPKMSFGEKTPVPGNGRGRGRLDNKQ